MQLFWLLVCSLSVAALDSVWYEAFGEPLSASDDLLLLSSAGSTHERRHVQKQHRRIRVPRQVQSLATRSNISNVTYTANFTSSGNDSQILQANESILDFPGYTDLNAPNYTNNYIPFGGGMWYNNETLYTKDITRQTLASFMVCACNCSYVAWSCCGIDVAGVSTDVAAAPANLTQTSHGTSVNIFTSSQGGAFVAEFDGCDSQSDSSGSGTQSSSSSTQFGIIAVATGLSIKNNTPNALLGDIGTG